MTYFKITAKRAEKSDTLSLYEKFNTLLPVEIDSEYDFGTFFYKVWIGERNIGVFREEGEKWSAYPFYGNPDNLRTLYSTPDAARIAIIRSYWESLS